MRRFTVVAALAVAGVLAVACGGDNNASSTTAPPAATTPAATTPAPSPSESPSASESPVGGATTLELQDNVFVPADLTVASGAELTLDNTGAGIHNFSVEGQSIDKDVQPGETETETIELPAGTYTMFCKYHRALGMEGTLTVTG